MASLGSRIKYLREKNNISQIEFAKKLGVSNTVLSRYESGDRKPDYDTLQLIADLFEVSTDYLLGRTSKTQRISQIKDEGKVFEVAKSTNFDELELEIAKVYMQLSPDDRKRLIEMVRIMFPQLHDEHSATLSTDSPALTPEQIAEDEAEKYRLEVLAELKGKTLSASDEQKGRLG